MKKKILCFMLAIFMILPTFAIAGCGGGGGDSIPQSWKILKAEAELTMPCDYSVESDYAHSAHIEIEVPLEDGDVTYFYTVVEGKTTVYHMGIKNGTSTRELLLKKYYGPLLYGGTGSTYRIQGDEGHEGESMREVDETYFKSFGVEELDTAYKALNNYIANNWEAFTPYVEMDEYGSYYPDKLTDEKLNALRDYGVVINMYICDTAQMNASSTEIASLGIDKVAVYRKEGLKVTFWKGDKYWTISYSNDPLTRAVKNLLANNQFAIIGGPSTSDPDYCEYYFDGTNGFRMYTPNNTAVENRTDAYYKENSDNTYTLYTKQTSDGSWATTSASQSTFDMVTSAVKEQYIPFIYNNASISANFRLIEHEEKEDSNTPYYYYDYGFGRTLNGLTYDYSDIKIMAYKDSDDNTLRIYSISWKMQFSNKVAESAVYNMELSTFNIDIEYPTVG